MRLAALGDDFFQNTKYDTLEAALNKEDGLAVLGSFYEVSCHQLAIIPCYKIFLPGL